MESKYEMKLGGNMAKQEMIYEIAKCVCNACEMGRNYDGECDVGNNYKCCGISIDTANHIYEIFYRAVNK